MPRLYLLCALSIPLLAACSKPSVNVRMPPLPASLSQSCPKISSLPDPMIDPARAEWEADVLARYTTCAARHAATVEAWRATRREVNGE